MRFEAPLRFLGFKRTEAERNDKTVKRTIESLSPENFLRRPSVQTVGGFLEAKLEWHLVFYIRNLSHSEQQRLLKRALAGAAEIYDKTMELRDFQRGQEQDIGAMRKEIELRIIEIEDSEQNQQAT